MSTLRFDPATLQSYIAAVYVGHGFASRTASAMATHLVEASRAGVHSHGVERAPGYLDQLEAGWFDATAEPELVRDDGSVVLYDARGAIGLFAGSVAVDAARARLAEYPIVAITMRNAGHFGRLGAHVEPLARAGALAIACCSLPTYYRGVAWHGTAAPLMSSNPIAYAFPTAGDPVVADFSTSTVSAGKIRIWARDGVPALPDTVLLPDGTPTTDAAAFDGDPRGPLVPLGGATFGFKGSALALLVEALGGFMADEAWSDDTRRSTLTIIAMRTPTSFPAHAQEVADAVRAAPPLDPTQPTRAPGDSTNAHRRLPTINMGATEFAVLVTRGDTVGIPAPPPSYV